MYKVKIIFAKYNKFFTKYNMSFLDINLIVFIKDIFIIYFFYHYKILFKTFKRIIITIEEVLNSTFCKVTFYERMSF